MANAQQRGWGDPDAKGYRQKHIVTITAGGVKLHIRREVAHLFKGFLDELVATGYRLDVDADDWGYNNRDIRGRPGVKSNHAWGLAIDINALKNPMTEAHPGHAGQAGHDHRGVHTDMPRQTGALASKYGLKWGANYSGSRKDAMHFEFEGTPADVAKYPNPSAPTQPAPAPLLDQEDDDMFYVIGYEGGSALWLYFPQTHRKAAFATSKNYEDATKQKGFGGHLRLDSETVKAIPNVSTGQPGL